MSRGTPGFLPSGNLSVMDPGLAQARLQRMTSYQTDPALSVDDVRMLLQASRILDRNGVSWDDPTWIPTFALNWAAAEGWLWKMGACSNRYGFADGPTTFKRDQVFRQCVAMHEAYTAKAEPVVIRSQGATVVDRTFTPIPWWWALAGN